MNESLRTWGPVGIIVALLPIAFIMLRACAQPIGDGNPAVPEGSGAEPELEVGSSACAGCHASVHQTWRTSTHARAERGLTTNVLAPLDNGRMTVTTAEGPQAVTPVRAIGVDPLWQYLVPMGNGRLQVTQQAWDPSKDEFFDVFADGRRPGEWGHWTGGAMTWNAQCASCHNTGVRKGLTTSGYATEVAEVGVGCEACHGDATAHVRGDAPPIVPKDRWLDVCGSCHSRRAELTDAYVPGEPLLDHMRPAIVDGSETFYADGQIRDEDFEYTSFVGSKKHGLGFDCRSCHDPHSGGLLREGDALCTGCHLEAKTAPHDHHDGASSCTGCHMPVTTYMQRDPRHDHGILVPDPGIEGVPDVCTRCHTEQSMSWAKRIADQWWPDRPRDRRERAEQLQRARSGDASAVPGLVAQLRGGPTSRPAWQATAAAALGPFLGESADAVEALLRATTHNAAVVRMAAVETLAPASLEPAVRKALLERLTDERNAVRVAAARALRHELRPGDPRAADYQRYLAHNADQPAALLDAADWDTARGDPRAAATKLVRAISLDPGSPWLYSQLAVARAQLGDTGGAVRALEGARAAGADDADTWYRLGLAHHAAGDPARAREALATAVQRDPAHPRAGYNLGLAWLEAGETARAVGVLEDVVQRRPEDVDLLFGLASAYWNGGQLERAERVATRILEQAPRHAAATQLVQAISRTRRVRSDRSATGPLPPKTR